MLATLRKSLNHLVTKIFLGLLVLTFILWGIGDILRSSKGDIAFKVGEIEYTKAEWLRFYKSQFDRLSDEYKQVYGFNNPELRGLFFKQLVNSIMLKEEAKRLGICIGDDAVKYEIINNMPGLMRDGKFDKDLLNDFLGKMNISESFFIEKIREELAQKVLIETISSANLLNNNLLDQITEALYSRVDFILYSPDVYAFEVKEEPTDDQLQKILEANKELFTVPEKRLITFFKFNLEDATKVTEKVSPEELTDFYTTHSYLFTLPEKRKFLKMVFADEKQALANYNKLVAGEDFIKLAQSLNQEIDINAPAVTKEGFSPEVAKVIFSLNQNDISKPMHTPLGWCIFKIIDIISEFVQPLDTVRDEITKQINEQRCYNRYLKKIQDIELALAQNTSIESIADINKLKLQTATVSFDKSKFNNKNILQNKRFLNTVFSSAEGMTSNVVSSIPDNESFVVKVEKVEPEYVIVFDQIKTQLTDIWKSEMQEKMAMELMMQARSKIDQGEKFQDIKIKAINKSLSINTNKEFNFETLIEIFNTPVRQVTRIFNNGNNEKFFAKIVSVQKPSAAKLKKVVAQEASRLNNLQEVILYDYFMHLQKLYPVQVYDIDLEGSQ